MSDGAISQDEIDALLSGVDMGGIGSATSSSKLAANLDTSGIEEFVSTTTDNLKNNLDTMTGTVFQIGNPVVESVDRDGVLKKIPEMVVAVINDFSEGLVGDHVFVLAPEFAQKLTALINKEENPELDDMALSVVSEIVSQHSGSEITKLSQTGKLPGLASNPADAVHVPKAMVRFPQSQFILITYPVSVDGGAYSLWEIISAEVAKGITDVFGVKAQQSSSGGLSPSEMQSMAAMGNNQNNMNSMQMNNMNMGMGGMQMQPNNMNMGMNMGMNVPNVQPLQYPQLQVGVNGTEQGNIGLIMDVFMEMTVELGRTQKQIKDIVSLGEGTIITLDKLAGEPVDILVNHKPIAKGEVVVIDENFGVRVTEILSQNMERLTDLH